MEFHLTWPGHELVLDDPATVIDRLEALDGEFQVQRRSVFVGIDTEQTSLDVALGVMHALVFVEGEDDPGYIAAGGSTSDREMTLEFDDDVMSIPESNLVATEQAMAAVREFLATGTRPDNVEWDEF